MWWYHLRCCVIVYQHYWVLWNLKVKRYFRSPVGSPWTQSSFLWRATAPKGTVFLYQPPFSWFSHFNRKSASLQSKKCKLTMTVQTGIPRETIPTAGTLQGYFWRNCHFALIYCSHITPSWTSQYFVWSSQRTGSLLLTPAGSPLPEPSMSN